MAQDVLPDSRLQNETLGSVMADWKLTSGGTVRIEVVPTFCANCGAVGDYVPKENTSFAFYLCQPCFDAYGAIANTYVMPDQLYWRKVAHEMEARHGHHLTSDEIAILNDRGRLGTPLELLMRESPYPEYREG